MQSFSVSTINILVFSSFWSKNDVIAIHTIGFSAKLVQLCLHAEQLEEDGEKENEIKYFCRSDDWGLIFFSE